MELGVAQGFKWTMPKILWSQIHYGDMNRERSSYTSTYTQTETREMKARGKQTSVCVHVCIHTYETRGSGSRVWGLWVRKCFCF